MRRGTIIAALALAMGAAIASKSSSGSSSSPADGFADAIAAADAAQNGPQVVLDPSTGTAGPSLADVLTLERKASLWWEYARDVASVTARITHAGHTTLLVPTDAAIMALPHKPHQNPGGGTSDSDSQKNVEDFLGAHIVPDDMQVGVPAKTLGGGKVILEKRDGGLFVVPGDARVIGETSASNGKVYYLDGAVKY